MHHHQHPQVKLLQLTHSEHSLRNGDSWHHLHCYKITTHHKRLGLWLHHNTMCPPLLSHLKIALTTRFMRSSKKIVNKKLLVYPFGCPLHYQHQCPAPQHQPCVRAISKRPHLQDLCLRTHPPHSDPLCCHFQGVYISKGVYTTKCRATAHPHSPLHVGPLSTPTAQLPCGTGGIPCANSQDYT